MNPPARHNCGICDGPLEFEHFDSSNYAWWVCKDCEEWHTAQDCCVNPLIKVGDVITLVSMGNDPDPILPGTVGTVTCINVPDQSVPQHLDQIGVEWENGRALFLLANADRFELVRPFYVIHEEAEVA